MVDWPPPPEFGAKGQPPPVSSTMSIDSEAFSLMLGRTDRPRAQYSHSPICINHRMI
jgi:hypothetical protein